MSAARLQRRRDALTDRRRTVRRSWWLGMVLVVTLAPWPVAAQAQAVATRTRLDTLLTATSGTPDGKGLVTVALLEARTAAQEALLASQATTDLTAMRRHAQGVLHAIDPTLVATGPGLGYGLKVALAAITTEVQATAEADRAADATLLTQRALSASANAAQWASELVAVAQQIASATSAAEAAALVPTLGHLARHLTWGSDATSTRIRSAPAQDGLLMLQRSLASLRVGRERLALTADDGGPR